MATIVSVELGLVPIQTTVGSDFEAVANQRLTAGATIMTFLQSSSREWRESRSRSQFLDMSLV